MTERPGPPPLDGRRVRLRAVSRADYDFLYAIFTAPEAIYAYRFRGSTPSPDAFEELLWRQVLVQFIIERTRDRARVGLVTAYNPNLASGFAHISMVLHPQFFSQGWTIEAPLLFVNYLFKTWNFRKLYGESLTPTVDHYAKGLGRLFHEEGRLRDHDFYNGQLVDLHYLAVYRDEWYKTSGRLIRRYLGEDALVANDGA